MRTRPVASTAGLLVAAIASARAQQPPFKTGVERIVVDVQVVDKDGRPIPTLTADDFEVRFDQGIRKVATVQFIRDAAVDTPAAGAPTSAAPSAQPVDAAPPAGRDFVVAVDESSFHTRYAPAAARAARGFIERLSPVDRVGLYLYPVSRRSFVMTTDHVAVAKSLDAVVGTLDPPVSEFHLTKSDVIDISAGDPDALARVAARACSRGDRSCRDRIKAEATAMATLFESQVATSMGGLRTLFMALRQDPERKTVVVVSGGLLASDRVGGRPDVSGVITTLGELAARSNLTLYVLHMDSSFLEAFSAPNRDGSSTSPLRDQYAEEGGLDRLAGTAGGTLVRVEPGGEDHAFQRILRETSAHYVLGVEPVDRDRDGRPHYISVKVKIHGAEVRSRRTVVIPVGG